MLYMGLNVEQLAEGRSNLTYEEIEFVLKGIPSMQMLSKNLKNDLKLSKLYM